MLSRLRPIWPLFAALASGAMLIAAIFYFQGYLGLQPCPLCMDQRYWHWAVLGVGLMGFVITRLRPQWTRWIVILVGLVLLGSAAQGAYHVAVEQRWVVAQCDIRGGGGSLVFDPNAPLVVPQCDQIVWDLFGISMAGYNALISLALALLSFAIAFAPERK